MCSKTKALQEILSITKSGFPTPEIMEIEKIAHRVLNKKVVFRETDFEKFWKAYPKREGANPKERARRAFEKAIQDDDMEIIIRAANNYDGEEDKRFTPQAATWLNEKRYLDVAEKPKFDPDRKSLMDFGGDYAKYKAYLDGLST
jgi:hypothetical protein